MNTWCTWLETITKRDLQYFDMGIKWKNTKQYKLHCEKAKLPNERKRTTLKIKFLENKFEKISQAKAKVSKVRKKFFLIYFGTYCL